MARAHKFQVNIKMSSDMYDALEIAATEFGLVNRAGEPNMTAICRVMLDVSLTQGADHVELVRRAYIEARNEVFVEVRDQFHEFLEGLAREMPVE